MKIIVLGTLILLISHISFGKKYSYFDKSISLFIITDSVGDSIHARIKIINRTTSDIYASQGYFYIHDLDGRRYFTGHSVTQASNILDLGHLMESQNYLHLHRGVLKISAGDSFMYTCISEMPKRINKLTINFDYLSTQNISRKKVNKILTPADHPLNNSYYSIVDVTKYTEKCTLFKFEIE